VSYVLTSGCQFSILLLSVGIELLVSCGKAGIGLMILQQFSGINAVMLYSSSIFSTAGKL